MTDKTRNNISTAIYSFAMLIGLFTSSIELILFSGFILVTHTIRSK